MEDILTQNELLKQLDTFRYIIQNFDYSALKNITFINLDALYCYIEKVEDNPFKLQYDELQKILDIIEPYIPFTFDIDNTNINDIADIFVNKEECQNEKKFFSLKKRINFTNTVRLITTENQWKNIINICENIRNFKSK